MGSQDNIERVRQFYAAGPPEDDSARTQFAIPNVVWHVPGDPSVNPVAGRYEGHADVFGLIGQRMQPLDRWTLDVRAVMANEDLVMALVDLVGERGEHRVACPGGHVFRFAPDGRIAEVWGFVADQAELDELFAS